MKHSRPPICMVGGSPKHPELTHPIITWVGVHLDPIQAVSISAFALDFLDAEGRFIVTLALMSREKTFFLNCLFDRSPFFHSQIEG